MMVNLRFHKIRRVAGGRRREELDLLLKRLFNGESFIQGQVTNLGKQRSILYRRQLRRWGFQKNRLMTTCSRSDLDIGMDSTLTNITMKKWVF